MGWLDGSPSGVKYKAPYGANNTSKTDVAPWWEWDGFAWISGRGEVFGANKSLLIQNPHDNHYQIMSLQLLGNHHNRH